MASWVKEMNAIKASLILLSLLCLCGCESSHPKDQTLLDNFKKHERDFEKLITMLRRDKKLQRVDDTWTRPSDPQSIGVSKERIREYRALFSKLSIPRGFYAFHDPERFTFIASTHGLSVSGSAKGYAYLAEKPDLVVSNLESYWSERGQSFTAYQHIKGNWYLYFDFED